MAEHLAELATEPQIRSTYRALSRATVELARQRGRLRPAEAESVLAVLAEHRDGPDEPVGPDEHGPGSPADHDDGDDPGQPGEAEDL